MPSRHNRKAKSTVSTYSEKKSQTIPSKIKNISQSAPTITVTDASPSEDILHSSWKVLYVFQFITLFRHHINLPAISLDQLESLLLFQNNETNDSNDTQQSDPIGNDHGNKSSVSSSSRESSVADGSIEKQEQQLAKLIVPIMASLYDDKKRRLISDRNYTRYIYKYLYNHSVEEDIQEILGKYPDLIPFSRLALLEKIDILKELVDSVFETGAALQWKNTLSPEDMRAFPMGKDSEGWSYWVFEDSRLYREIAISPRKKETDYTFELIANTQEDWEKWMNKFSLKSSKPTERALALNLQEYGTAFIQKVEAKKMAKLREEAKQERAKLIDLLPRKRSRRIEVKSEAEEKRRQLEELEQAQWEYEEAQREQERKEQEEEAERDRQTMHIEEARLREDVYQALDRKVSDIIQTKRSQSETITDDNCTGDIEDVDEDRMNRLKFLRSKLKKSANYDEVVDKVSGWTTLLDDDYKVIVTPIASLSKTSQEQSNLDQEDESIDIEKTVSHSDTNLQPTEPSSPSITTPLAHSPEDQTSSITETSPAAQLPYLDESGIETAKTDATPTPPAKRGRPRKAIKPVAKVAVNTHTPLPPFTKAIHFTGIGTKSDLKDPLLKLILCTLISYIRQHPVIADLEFRNTKKWKRKRKASVTSTSLDLYTIHKKLLLDQYKSDNTQDQANKGMAISSSTTEITELDTSNEQNLAGGLSAFEHWLKDMDLVLGNNDLDNNVDMKMLIYNLFSVVFDKVD